MAWKTVLSRARNRIAIGIASPYLNGQVLEKSDIKNIPSGQDVEVDLMRPEDAAGVAALFRAVYHNDYPIKIYYDPRALIAANRKGEIISCVSRTPRGDIVGHNAFYPIAPCKKVFECGAGLVLPAYRNTAGLLGRMLTLGIRMAPEFGGEGIYGEQICSHLFTQKSARSLGNIPMGLEVDLSFQEGGAQKRVSSFHGYQTLKPYPHTVYLPGTYERALRFLYEGLKEERHLAPCPSSPSREHLSRIEAEIYGWALVSRISVLEIGEDFMPAIGIRESEAAEKGVIVYQVWLPLASPSVNWAVECLRSRGYFLGGLLPRWFDTDGLLMQRVFHTPDWDSIQILQDRSREIFRIVRDDWESSNPGLKNEGEMYA